MNHQAKIHYQDLKFNLYYSLEESPSEEVNKVLDILRKVKQAKKIRPKIITKLSEDEYIKLKREISASAGPGKFKIVSGGGAALAISKTKKLNFKQGPILVILHKDEIIRVCPYGEQGVKGSRISPFDYLTEILNSSSDVYSDLDEKTFTEQNLRNLIIKKPSLLGEELEYLDVEVALDSAIVDLVLVDSNKNHLLLEIKLDAKDKTIGQVTRYNIDDYSNRKGISPKKIRKGIVTLSYTGQIVKACKENMIELFVLDFRSIGFKPK
jgi:RecB family endonuclease NucS